MTAEDFLFAAEPEEQRSWRRFVPHAAGLLALAVVGFLLYRLVSSDSTVRKNVSDVVTVRLVQPPPPPPPPPKQEEPTKETPQPKPEPMEEPVRTETPPPLAAPSAAMPGPAGPPGVAGLPSGGSGIGIPGGGGGIGGGGGGGNPFGSYAALLQSRVQSAVQRQPALRRTRYRIEVQVWLTEDGAPNRVELLSSLGSKELDKQFRETLLGITRLPQAPPADMPQPIVLKVNSL